MENYEHLPQGKEQKDSAYQIILDNYGNYNGLKEAIVEKIPVAKESNIIVGSEGFARFILEDCAGVSDDNFEILEKIINGIAREVESLKNAGIVQENIINTSSNTAKKSKVIDKQNGINKGNNNLEDGTITTNDYEHFLNYGEYPDKVN